MKYDSINLSNQLEIFYPLFKYSVLYLAISIWLQKYYTYCNAFKSRERETYSIHIKLLKNMEKHIYGGFTDIKNKKPLG